MERDVELPLDYVYSHQKKGNNNMHERPEVSFVEEYRYNPIL